MGYLHFSAWVGRFSRLSLRLTLLLVLPLYGTFCWVATKQLKNHLPTKLVKRQVKDGTDASLLRTPCSHLPIMDISLTPHRNKLIHSINLP